MEKKRKVKYEKNSYQKHPFIKNLRLLFEVFFIYYNRNPFLFSCKNSFTKNSISDLAHDINRQVCRNGGQSDDLARANSKNKVSRCCAHGLRYGIPQRSIGAHVVSAILFKIDALDLLTKAFSSKCLAKSKPQNFGVATSLHCAQVKYCKTPLFADYLHRQTLWKGTTS